MNLKRSSIIFLFIVSVTAIQCNWQSKPNENTDPEVTVDTATGSDEFDSEIKAYESEDRVIWQKPDLVIDQLGNVEGKVVADLGAGTGYFSRRIVYKGANVIAIDIDPQAIRWMEVQKARFPPELQEKLVIRKAEPDDPKLAANEVDIVLLVNTYSYISERVAYFSKLKNAIRRGGSIVIIDFKKKETPFGPPVEERLDVAEVEKELKEAGYTIIKIDERALEYQYIIKAART